jgi:hypothetical protein
MIPVELLTMGGGALLGGARIAMDEIYDMEVACMTADPTITSIPADKEAEMLEPIV